MNSQGLSVLIEELGRDVRHALRALRRTPVFTATSVLILSVAIGMATAVFAVLQSVMLRDLPVREPDRIVALRTFRDPMVTLALVNEQIIGLRQESRTLQDVAGVIHWGAQAIPLVGDDGALVLKQAMVTANFFELLGVRPALGRTFAMDDGLEGAAPVAVISCRAWQGQFGGDPNVLGRRLTPTEFQQTYSIVGVAPPGLDYPVGVDYWLPMRLNNGMTVVGRLASNATPEAARSEFLSIAQRLDRDRRIPVYPVGAEVKTLTNAVLGDTRSVLLTLTLAVLLLLVIGCVNVGNLLLLRGTLRARELQLRRALGASPLQIKRLLFMESAVLGAAGCASGLLLAHILLRLLLSFSPQIPRAEMIRVEGMSMAVASGVALLAVLLFGVFPALTTARGNLVSSARIDTGAATQSRGRRRVRESLVVVQVALSVVMLSGAGLLIRSLQRLEHLDLGYDSDRLSIVVLSVPWAEYDSGSEAFDMFSELYARLRAQAGVTGITPILYEPFLGANLMQLGLDLEGQPGASMEASAPVPVEVGGAEYFKTFGIPILRGRGFLESDREEATMVVVVSESLARRFWPGQEAIGRRVRLAGSDSTSWRTVVGVAGDTRFRRLRQATPTIYFPWRQATTFGVFAIQTQNELASVLPAMRRTVRDIHSQLDVWVAKPMTEHLSGQLTHSRLSAFLLSGFGGTALFLAASGLYGIMACAVRENRRDLGIRMALGATPERLRRGVLGRSLAVAAIGVASGLVGAFWGSRTLTALLFDVSPTDPTTMVVVSGLLLSVAFLAAYLPAQHATRADPLEALRAE